MVEVFRTNITSESDAHRLKDDLSKRFPKAFVHFDLEDCDRVMKVIADEKELSLIPVELNKQGFICAPLED
jgi:hypothetical protein